MSSNPMSTASWPQIAPCNFNQGDCNQVFESHLFAMNESADNIEAPVNGVPATHWHGRPAVPAFLVSAIFHVAFLLVLSLVVLGSNSDKPFHELLASKAEEAWLDESPTFELQPDFQTPVDTAPEELAEIKIDLAVDAPPRLESPPKEEDSDAVPVETPSEASEPGENLMLPVNASGGGKVALAIQKRVTDAGGKQGEVQFALAWKNVNDVDLHVIAPSGERISHMHRRSNCRGMLDVDMNVRGDSQEPVENVRWLSDAPWGRYTVLINLFRVHRPPGRTRLFRGSPFQLLVQLGTESSIESETVSTGKQVEVYRFQYIPQTLSPSERERLLLELRSLQEREESVAGPLLEDALSVKNKSLRQRLLNNLIIRYPHTDAAIEAMRNLGGNISKT